MVNLEFRNRGAKPKKPKKPLFGNSKGTSKDVMLVCKTLCVGLSFGTGILGALYLINLGLPEFVVGIFGTGVVASHLHYITLMNKGAKDD